jgi:hypothetical protein
MRLVNVLKDVVVEYTLYKGFIVVLSKIIADISKLSYRLFPNLKK